ncbi:MAG: helix-turn-helix domain-containing protein [Clostridia bacterium]|nr:helix-turn-helix domain-containing protein [Clostridia bacterium]
MISTYTVEELVPILKRKEKTIRNYINEGELKASLLGSGYVVTEDDVKEFLINNQVYDYDNLNEEDDEEDSKESEE